LSALGRASDPRALGTTVGYSWVPYREKFSLLQIMLWSQFWRLERESFIRNSATIPKKCLNVFMRYVHTKFFSNCNLFFPLDILS
jgi:hypothetical protein